mgnify:CR=1 FL=1
MKYRNIDEVKPSAVNYMKAHILISCGNDKDCALYAFGISEQDYDDNIEMIVQNYDDWAGYQEIEDLMPDAK